LGTATIEDFGSDSGVGYDLASNFLASDTNGTPSTFTQASTKKGLKIRKKVYALQFKVSSSTADTDFTILGVQAKGTLIKSKMPSSWKN